MYDYSAGKLLCKGALKYTHAGSYTLDTKILVDAQTTVCVSVSMSTNF